MTRPPGIVFEANGPLPDGVAWIDVPDFVLMQLAQDGDERAQQELQRRAGLPV